MGDVPGPSKTSYITPGKSTENFFRLCQLIMTICSDLLRDILGHYIKPSNLRSELDKNKKKVGKYRTFSKEVLYTQPTEMHL